MHKINVVERTKRRRLTIDEWTEAINDEWIDKQRSEILDELDQLLVKSLKICYMTGKGNNHMVPLLIPEDTIPALKYLCDKAKRQQTGVNKKTICSQVPEIPRTMFLAGTRYTVLVMLCR